jgi:hypothetical protein
MLLPIESFRSQSKQMPRPLEVVFDIIGHQLSATLTQPLDFRRNLRLALKELDESTLHNYGNPEQAASEQGKIRRAGKPDPETFKLVAQLGIRRYGCLEFPTPAEVVRRLTNSDIQL